MFSQIFRNLQKSPFVRALSPTTKDCDLQLYLKEILIQVFSCQFPVFFYHLHPLHRHIDITAIITKISPVHIASRLAMTGNLWFPSLNHQQLGYVPLNLLETAQDTSLRLLLKRSWSKGKLDKKLMFLFLDKMFYFLISLYFFFHLFANILIPLFVTWHHFPIALKQVFIQVVLMSVTRHKKLNLTTEFWNSTLI